MQLMTHVVVGYPSLRATEKIIDALARAGSDKIELQIPFSEPVADGPVIANANQTALTQGINAKKCLSFAKKMTKQYPTVQFYFMSYLNPILRYGLSKFCRDSASAGIRGFIVPDLPVEEADKLLTELKKNKLNLIFVLAPNTTVVRMKKITAKAKDFLYCAARLGVTGKQTSFTADLKKFLTRVKKYTRLPLAVGFGIEQPADITAVRKAGGQIAVVGSAILRTHQKSGVKAVAKLVRKLKY